MRRLPKQFLVVAGGGTIAILVLCAIALRTSEWAVVALGGVVVLASLLILREQAAQRRALHRLASRVDVLQNELGEFEVALKDLGVHARRISDRPMSEQSAREQEIAEIGARFDWISRRQAEILRELRAVRSGGG